VNGALTCPAGLKNGRCKTWRFNPQSRMFPGENYDVYFQPANGGLTDKAGNAMNATFPTVRAATTVDHTDPEMSFQWGVRNYADAYGGSVFTENSGGATTSFTFKGRKITWFTVRGSDQGLARVRINDSANPVDTVVNNYAAATSTKVPIVFKGLSAGKHTITIDVQGGLGDPSATDAAVSVDAFQVGTKSVVRTPTMKSRWTEVISPYAYTLQPGASFSVQFRGPSVTWQAFFGENDGIAEVFLDGVSQGNVDLYGPYQFAPVTFNGLTDTRHTLTVVNTGTKNPLSSDTVISVDRIQLG
jgi:hypothetical protein